jgi:hypothetical protein
VEHIAEQQDTAAGVLKYQAVVQGTQSVHAATQAGATAYAYTCFYESDD